MLLVAVLGGLNDVDAAGVFFFFQKTNWCYTYTKLLKAPVHFTKKKLSPVKKIKLGFFLLQKNVTWIWKMAQHEIFLEILFKP